MVNRVKLIHVISLLISLHASGNVHAHLFDILKVDEHPDVQLSIPPENVFQYMSAGVPQIFWEYVDRNSCDIVSDGCRNALKVVSQGFKSFNLNSYKFIDSSGKTAPAFLSSTISSLGDYDQCISINGVIDNHLVKGKYCAIDTHPVISQNCTPKECVEKNVLSFHQIPVFRGMPLISTLCLPHECSSDEIQQMLSIVLRPFGMKVAGDINCDTMDSVSFYSKIMSLNLHQIIAGLFLVSLVSAVIASTAAHVYHGYVDSTKFALPSIAESLSLVTTTKSLLWAKDPAPEVIVFDTIKVSTILAGILGHILVCAEIPISYFVMALLNDAGLVGVPVLTGIATALIAFPLAKANKLPFVPAIVDRFSRFLPPMMLMTALELLWLFTGNGPLFTRVANWITNKCTRNWWLNMLFINNYFIDGIDICGGSSFYTSIDLQLFILGLIFVYLFTFSSKVGYLFTCVAIASSWLYTANDVSSSESTAILFRANPIPLKISGYFDHVHMVTATYIPGYLIGLCTGYAVSTNRITVELKSLTDHVRSFGTALGASVAVTSVTTFYNSLEVIPEEYAFLVVIFNRSAQSISVCLMYLYFTALFKGKSTSSGETSDANVDNSAEFNLLKGFYRLTFAVYVSNYLVIRTLFFTSRATISPHLIDSGIRCIYYLVFIYVVAFVFHVMFLSPLDNIRKYLLEGDKKIKTT